VLRLLVLARMLLLWTHVLFGLIRGLRCGLLQIPHGPYGTAAAAAATAAAAAVGGCIIQAC
jgi:hypothetical protein